MVNNEESFPKTSINWAVGIYGQPLPSLDKIRDLVNKVFTYLYKIGCER